MTVLLDANICIHYLNGRYESIRNHLRATSVENIRLCTIAVAELYFGAFNSQQVEQNLDNIEGFIQGLVILPFDELCMRVYGEIRARLKQLGTPLGSNDLFIAAIAMAYKCVLITDNTQEFSKVEGLTITNWVER